jgi:hypothetical protein
MKPVMKTVLIEPNEDFKQVYSLELEHKSDPEYVSKAQSLTLDKNKPLMGLRGSKGLYGSDEWWENIRKGKIKSKVYSGKISETYFAGQDSRWGDEVNSIKVELENGEHIKEGIYFNDKADKKLFIPGAKIKIAYVYDELKKQSWPLIKTNFLNIVIEVVVEVGANKRMQPDASKAGAADAKRYKSHE